MKNKYKILLNENRSANSVNVNSHVNINIENKGKPIPLGEVEATVNQYEQFEEERKDCTTYRFYGVVNPIINNALYNDNVNIVNDNGVIRGIKVPSNSIFVNDGWYGFYDQFESNGDPAFISTIFQMYPHPFGGAGWPILGFPPNGYSNTFFSVGDTVQIEYQNTSGQIVNGSYTIFSTAVDSILLNDPNGVISGELNTGSIIKLILTTGGATPQTNPYNDNESSECQFKTFDAGFDRLGMVDDDGKPNYLFKITYPFENRDINLVENNGGISLKDGLQIIEKSIVTMNDRNYVAFTTVINHGLKKNDQVNLYNFVDTTNGGLYINKRTFKIIKLGNQNNNNPSRIFVLDIDPTSIDFQIGKSTIKRNVNGKQSDYYVRRLKSLTTNEIDYDVYPAAYGVTYYDDREASFYFKSDVDINGLRDNLNRPLSQLFFTVVKNDNDSNPTDIKNYYWLEQQKNLPNNANNSKFWETLKGGYETEKNTKVNYNIRAVGANYPGGSPNYPQVYYENIDESNDEFDADIVEYNEYELLERTLEEVFHRFNSVYRENLNLINNNLENQLEGYIYNPHQVIQIREFSTYIEEGDSKNTEGIPDYATLKYSATTSNPPSGELSFLKLTSTSKVYKWRDLLDIGFIDGSGNGVEYPFESGAHYIYLNQNFYLYRQDPPCNVAFTIESLTLPQDRDLFDTYINQPNFYDYEVGDIISILGVPGALDLLDPNISPTNVDVRFIKYVGEYNLGNRNTPGGCIDYSLLELKNITDEC
tara:strand:- start:54 stop:2339 length:2286 start_codon:yes stop_codon:yes gene_type:complete